MYGYHISNSKIQRSFQNLEFWYLLVGDNSSTEMCGSDSLSDHQRVIYNFPRPTRLFY